MIKYCIFDLDGTLLDTIGTITYYVNAALDVRGILPITVEECKSFVGNGAARLIERALAYRSVTDADVVRSVLEDYKARYDLAPLYLTAPYDGITELIYGLNSMGVSIGVVSNKPDTATVPIVRHFFGESIQKIRGGRDGIPLKPDPTSSLALLTELGGRPEECIFIGDTSVDMLTGGNMKCFLKVGVMWGFRGREELLNAGADRIVYHPSEILDIIREGEL